MTTVEIEYCHPCGFLERALSLQESIHRAFANGALEATQLRVGDHGVFVVRVDDNVVFDIAEEAFDVDDVVRSVRAAM